MNNKVIAICVAVLCWQVEVNAGKTSVTNISTTIVSTTSRDKVMENISTSGDGEGADNQPQDKVQKRDADQSSRKHDEDMSEPPVKYLIIRNDGTAVPYTQDYTFGNYLKADQKNSSGKGVAPKKAKEKKNAVKAAKSGKQSAVKGPDIKNFIDRLKDVKIMEVKTTVSSVQPEDEESDEEEYVDSGEDPNVKLVAYLPSNAKFEQSDEKLKRNKQTKRQEIWVPSVNFANDKDYNEDTNADGSNMHVVYLPNQNYLEQKYDSREPPKVGIINVNPYTVAQDGSAGDAGEKAQANDINKMQLLAFISGKANQEQQQTFKLQNNPPVRSAHSYSVTQESNEDDNKAGVKGKSGDRNNLDLLSYLANNMLKQHNLNNNLANRQPTKAYSVYQESNEENPNNFPNINDAKNLQIVAFMPKKSYFQQPIYQIKQQDGKGNSKTYAVHQDLSEEITTQPNFVPKIIREDGAQVQVVTFIPVPPEKKKSKNDATRDQSGSTKPEPLPSAKAFTGFRPSKEFLLQQNDKYPFQPPGYTEISVGKVNTNNEQSHPVNIDAFQRGSNMWYPVNGYAVEENVENPLLQLQNQINKINQQEYNKAAQPFPTNFNQNANAIVKNGPSDYINTNDGYKIAREVLHNKIMAQIAANLTALHYARLKEEAKPEPEKTNKLSEPASTDQPKELSLEEILSFYKQYMQGKVSNEHKKYENRESENMLKTGPIPFGQQNVNVADENTKNIITAGAQKKQTGEINDFSKLMFTNGYENQNVQNNDLSKVLFPDVLKKQSDFSKLNDLKEKSEKFFDLKKILDYTDRDSNLLLKKLENGPYQLDDPIEKQRLNEFLQSLRKENAARINQFVKFQKIFSQELSKQTARKDQDMSPGDQDGSQSEIVSQVIIPNAGNMLPMQTIGPYVGNSKSANSNPMQEIINQQSFFQLLQENIRNNLKNIRNGTQEARKNVNLLLNQPDFLNAPSHFNQKPPESNSELQNLNFDDIINQYKNTQQLDTNAQESFQQQTSAKIDMADEILKQWLNNNPQLYSTKSHVIGNTAKFAESSFRPQSNPLKSLQQNILDEENSMIQFLTGGRVPSIDLGLQNKTGNFEKDPIIVLGDNKQNEPTRIDFNLNEYNQRINENQSQEQENLREFLEKLREENAARLSMFMKLKEMVSKRAPVNDVGLSGDVQEKPNSINYNENGILYDKFRHQITPETPNYHYLNGGKIPFFNHYAFGDIHKIKNATKILEQQQQQQNHPEQDREKHLESAADMMKLLAREIAQLLQQRNEYNATKDNFYPQKNEPEIYLETESENRKGGYKNESEAYEIKLHNFLKTLREENEAKVHEFMKLHESLNVKRGESDTKGSSSKKKTSNKHRSTEEDDEEEEEDDDEEDDPVRRKGHKLTDIQQKIELDKMRLRHEAMFREFFKNLRKENEARIDAFINDYVSHNNKPSTVEVESDEEKPETPKEEERIKEKPVVQNQTVNGTINMDEIKQKVVFLVIPNFHSYQSLEKNPNPLNLNHYVQGLKLDNYNQLTGANNNNNLNSVKYTNILPYLGENLTHLYGASLSNQDAYPTNKNKFADLSPEGLVKLSENNIQASDTPKPENNTINVHPIHNNITEHNGQTDDEDNTEEDYEESGEHEAELENAEEEQDGEKKKKLVCVKNCAIINGGYYTYRTNPKPAINNVPQVQVPVQVPVQTPAVTLPALPHQNPVPRLPILPPVQLGKPIAINPPLLNNGYFPTTQRFLQNPQLPKTPFQQPFPFNLNRPYLNNPNAFDYKTWHHVNEDLDSDESFIHKLLYKYLRK